jgi:uncharacterized protein
MVHATAPSRPWWGRLAIAALLWCLACGLMAPAQAQATVPAPATANLKAVPALSAPVIDQTGTLDATALAALEAQLTAIEQQHGSQVVVLVVDSTQPEDIAAYAWRVADTWKIGRKDVGDGVLLIVALNDRRVRIEVARALEGAIPDLAASRIIEGAITPAFRQGDVAGGLRAGVQQIGQLIAGEGLPPPATSKSSPQQGLDLNTLVVFGLFGVPFVHGILSAVVGRKWGAALTGGLAGGVVWVITTSVLLGLLAWPLASVLALAMGHSGGRPGRGGWGGPPMGGGWGGGFGGGGGGFSSGGGGSFGGGGASGRW